MSATINESVTNPSLKEIVAKEREINWANRDPIASRVAGVIIYIASKDGILVYLRDPDPKITHPDTLNFFGGWIDPEDDGSPEATITREVSEELIDKTTGLPYEIGELAHFSSLTDQRGVRFDLFSTEIDEEPNVSLGDEGKEIVLVSREDVMLDNLHVSDGRPIEFSLDYIHLVRNFFEENQK